VIKIKIKWKLLILCILIPLAVGGIAGLISRDSMKIFTTLNKPAISPPGWLFPIVWTILYILMGIASYLVLTSGAQHKKISDAIKVYGIQLFFNFFWTILFFNFELYFISFVWLVLLWVLIVITMIMFYRVSVPSAYLLIPYLLWVTFAGYLNISIALMN